MKKGVFGKIGAALLVFVVALSFAASPMVSATPPSYPTLSGYFPYTYDPEFNAQNPNCWQVGLIGPYPRPYQNLPEGYWYPNTAFDSAWFPNNYAIVGGNGSAILHACSTYDLLWGGRGWSNAFVHQGSPPYTGVFEGRFKAGQDGTSVPFPVSGIIYNMSTQEPVGKHYLYITAKLTKDDLNCWNSNNGLLVAFIFQYQFVDGSWSAYDSPANTNNMQSLHVDVFIHRMSKYANVYVAPWAPGWYYTLGDKYNSDIHLQYVHNGKMNVGQEYTFVIDYGALINGIKGHLGEILASNNLPKVQAITLRYIQVSAETIGGEIGAQIDSLEFVTFN